MKKYLLLVIVLMPLYSSGQIQRIWSIEHIPFGNQQNWCYQLYRDQMLLNSNGDIICGWNFDLQTLNVTGLGITSYSANGMLNWEQEYHGGFSGSSQFLSLSIDSLDNVYSMGIVNNQTFVMDNAIIKYNSSGSQLWVAEDDSVESGGERSLIFGDKYYMQSRFHPNINRYDLNGNLIDTLDMGVFNSNDFTSTMSIKKSGNDIYLGGMYYTWTSVNGMLYASKAVNGDSVIWESVLDATPDSERCIEIAPDNSGNLYMTARTNDSNINTSSMFTCAFEANTGDTLWTRLKHSSMSGCYALPTDIDVDNKGHVYVAANICDSLTMRNQATLIQYDAITGNENWTVAMDSGFAFWLDWVKICLDTTTSDVFFAYTLISNQGVYNTSIARIDSMGNLLWRELFDSVGRVEAFLNDQNNNLYISGNILSRFSLLTAVQEENRQDADINIFPNPASELLTIHIGEFNNRNFRSLKIVDMSGREYYQSNNIKNTLTIPCRTWPVGMYFITVYSEEGRVASYKIY